MGVIYSHPDVLDNGPAELLKVNQVAVLKAYAVADAHNVAKAAPNVVLTETITPGDMSLSNHDAHDRKWQCNGKAGVLALIATLNTDDLHIGYFDTTTSRLLFVTDEITDQVIKQGNPVDVPAGEYRSLQPTAVV